MKLFGIFVSLVVGLPIGVKFNKYLFTKHRAIVMLTILLAQAEVTLRANGYKFIFLYLALTILSADFAAQLYNITKEDNIVE